jgi:hypothetical protein
VSGAHRDRADRVRLPFLWPLRWRRVAAVVLCVAGVLLVAAAFI